MIGTHAVTVVNVMNLRINAEVSTARVLNNGRDSYVTEVMWAALLEKVPDVLSRCHTISFFLSFF